MFKNRFNAVRSAAAAGALTVAGASQAQATGPDVSALTGAVNFSTVSAGIMTVAGAVIGVYLVIKAAQFIIARVKGA